MTTNHNTQSHHDNDADIMDMIREEAQQAYAKDFKSNNRLAIILLVVAVVMMALWGFLFWQSDSPKLQLMWGLFFLAEALGIPISIIIYRLDDTRYTLQRENRRIELQLEESQRQIKELNEKIAQP